MSNFDNVDFKPYRWKTAVEILKTAVHSKNDNTCSGFKEREQHYLDFAKFLKNILYRFEYIAKKPD